MLYANKMLNSISTTSKIIVILIFILIICTLVTYISGNLTSNFFVRMVENLIPNILSLLVTVLFINSILNKDRSVTLKKINKIKAEHLYFCMNRLCFFILGYLKIIDKDGELPNYLGEKMDFVKAKEKFKIELDLNTLLEEFLSELKNSKDKKIYIDGFCKILEDFSKSTEDSIKNIYPAPSPRIISFFEHDLAWYRGAISIYAIPFEIRREPEVENTFKSSKEKEDFDNGFDLIYIKYNPINKKVQSLFEDIMEICGLIEREDLFSNI